jgi:hypothetical protein
MIIKTPEAYYKSCSLCHRLLTTDHFHKLTRSADGLQGHCKKCKRADHRKRDARKKAAQVG